MAGCGFHSSAQPTDAADSPVPDAPPDMAPPPDMMPPDMAPPGRTRVGLVGIWELDDAQGMTVADSSDVVPAVPLTVTGGLVTFSSGTMAVSGAAVIASGPKPHLDRDAMSAGAVTLEAWVSPATASQGAPGQPAVVGGLSASIVSRNIALLQDGKRWVGRVRTTSDNNGGPDLTSSSDILAGSMTHLVVVADATQRILYVNGQPDFVDPAPGPLLNWDQSYKMVLGNESSSNRPWTGTFALVALYARALAPAEIQTNYLAGANAR